MKWMTPFYTTEIPAEEIEGMKKEAESYDNKLYGTRCMIILPANANNLFEIISFHQLAIPYYQTLDIKVVGLAKDKDEAKELLCRIIEDMEKTEDGINVAKFFK